jgi:Ran GTPase-activating protein (RanGAP) involved in mRNA processing and transport
LLECLQPLQNLTTLDMSYTAISDASLKSFRTALQQTPLRALYLSSCRFTGDGGGMPFGEVFAGSLHLEQLHLSYNSISASALSSLFETICKLPHGLMKTLQVLDISHLRPGKETKQQNNGVALLAMVDRLLNHPNCSLHDLRLAQWPFAVCGVDNAGNSVGLCKSIGAALRRVTCSLVNTDLSYIPLEAADVRRVFQGVRVNSSLESLICSGFAVTADVAGSISAALTANNTLRVLDLSESFFGAKARTILDAYRDNNNAVQLIMH